jgi:hypothetical protein
VNSWLLIADNEKDNDCGNDLIAENNFVDSDVSCKPCDTLLKEDKNLVDIDCKLIETDRDLKRLVNFDNDDCMFTEAVSDLNRVAALADIMFSCRLCGMFLIDKNALVTKPLKFKLWLSCLAAVNAFSTTWFMLKLTVNDL